MKDQLLWPPSDGAARCPGPVKCVDIDCSHSTSGVYLASGHEWCLPGEWRSSVSPLSGDVCVWTLSLEIRSLTFADVWYKNLPRSHRFLTFILVTMT